jgi:hypothetical protein
MKNFEAARSYASHYSGPGDGGYLKRLVGFSKGGRSQFCHLGRIKHGAEEVREPSVCGFKQFFRNAVSSKNGFRNEKVWRSAIYLLSAFSE